MEDGRLDRWDRWEIIGNNRRNVRNEPKVLADKLFAKLQE